MFDWLTMEFWGSPQLTNFLLLYLVFVPTPLIGRKRMYD